MFFELSDGVIINLNHVVEIPVIDGGNAAVSIVMTDGRHRRVNKKDAQEMRALCLAISNNVIVKMT